MRKNLKSNWKQNNEVVRYFELIIKLGLTVIGIVLFFFLAFLFLDNKYNANGILVAIGTILGVLFSGFSAYIIIKRNFLKENNETDNNE